MRCSAALAGASLLLSVLLPLGAEAQQQSSNAPPPAAPTVPTVTERVEVVATKLPESPDQVPSSIEVITADELRNLGARDLRSALALAAGVSIAPGGDGGPASAVPEFWGLKEFDAFLLVVDGVPWGGAFNPSLAALSLTDVERIEILRGPAAVTYGATSFVGVIHVVHKNASASGRTASVHAGQFGSAGGLFSSKVPLGRGWDSRLTLDGDRQGYSDSRTWFARGHALWRNSTSWGPKGRFWFNVDLLWLDQRPASPSVRDGQVLSPLVPLDSNQNPSGAFQNHRAGTLMAGFERPLGTLSWTTTASAARTRQDILRGYLLTLDNGPDNARGIREHIDLTDIYADSHVSWRKGETMFAAGADFLHGMGTAHGADFDYTAALDGSSVPQAGVPSTLDVSIEDRRDFVGGYAMAEWQPVAGVRLDAGLRLNVTNEARDAHSGTEADAGRENTKTTVRPSGSLGVMWTAWHRDADRLALFADYRNTFKPAAFDFGIGEAEAEGLLKPETSQSVELGAKSRLFQGQVSAEVWYFRMAFSNLVVAQTVNGLPALANAGTERFQGIEGAIAWYLPHHLTGRATYSFHDARFRDYIAEFDGIPTQLGGKRIEMSARHLAAFGLVYGPEHGPTAGVEWSYVGSRYLNMRNTALADPYGTIGASVGYRSGKWELRVDGRNLTDERPPIAESELGDAQYYRLPARRVDATLTVRF